MSSPETHFPGFCTSSHRQVRRRATFFSVLILLILSFQSAEATDASESLLESLRQNLSEIQTSPEAKEQSLDWIEQSQSLTETEIKTLESEIERLDQLLGSQETSESSLSDRLKALSETQKILSAIPGVTLPKTVQFNRDVRPILSDKCFACHGPDAAKRKAGLRLDDGVGAFEALRSGNKAIVPGDRLSSELYRRITTSDTDDRMPPEDQKKQLSQDEIEILGRWIDEGAEYEEHWAYLPLASPTPPETDDFQWTRNGIDSFVLSQLEDHGLAPNPTADPRKLIRRLYFDLIGLPPTPEEVEAFVDDTSPDAYERLVDRLLGNPHFGEKWGRHWLDIARFAESHGYEQDYDRKYAYHYRDFVIKAFNEDLPFDTFTKWQIAGDEIEPENPLAMMATGFLAAGVHSTQITKNQVEKERYDELDDMSRTIGVAFLGITIGCARCHDHKYDPVSAHEYYSLLSTFTTAVRAEVDLDIGQAGYEREKARFDEEHKPLVEALKEYESGEMKDKLEDHLREISDSPKWALLDLQTQESVNGATFEGQADGSLFVGGPNAATEVYTFIAESDLSQITGFRLDTLAHDSLVGKGPGRAENGNFALSDIEVSVQPKDGEDAPIKVEIASASATFEQEGFHIAAAFDDDPNSAWAVDPEFGRDHSAVFTFAEPLAFEGGSRLTFTLRFNTNTGHGIGRPRLSITGEDSISGAEGEVLPAKVYRLLAEQSDEATPTYSEQDHGTLLSWFRTQDSKWADFNKKIEEHAKVEPKPDAVKVFVCSEGVTAVRNHTQGGDYLEETHHLTRGDPNQKGEVATQSFLSVLMKGPDGEARWQTPPPEGWRTSYRRRSLANWITDTEYGAGHLLARVIVNRLWQHHFGRGIVNTPSDYGFQGEAPTHPELLDWLANRLIENGWRLKPIHKLILMSSSFRQSSDFDREKDKLDPENKWVWRYEPRRLEAELIRDSLLSVGGLLDTSQFGPGTLDEDHTRRSIYFTTKRSQLIPMMTLFDAPDSLQSIGTRPTTTVPSQSLLLMNSDLARRCAEGFASRIEFEATEPSSQIELGYQIALGRPPTATEVEDSKAFLTDQSKSYANENSDEAKHLALIDFCQVLMGLNEFVYVD